MVTVGYPRRWPSPQRRWPRRSSSRRSRARPWHGRVRHDVRPVRERRSSEHVDRLPGELDQRDPQLGELALRGGRRHAAARDPRAAEEQSGDRAHGRDLLPHPWRRARVRLPRDLGPHPDERGPLREPQRRGLRPGPRVHPPDPARSHRGGGQPRRRERDFAHQLGGQVFTLYGGTLTGSPGTARRRGRHERLIRARHPHVLGALDRRRREGHAALRRAHRLEHRAARLGPAWAPARSRAPYHVRITAADGESVGNRDNQIQSGAILLRRAS